MDEETEWVLRSKKDYLRSGLGIRFNLVFYLMFKLKQVADYVFRQKKVSMVAEAFVQNLFPYFKDNPLMDMHVVEKEFVPELSSFWADVSELIDHEFSALEKNILATDLGVPIVFSGYIKSAAGKRMEFSKIYQHESYNEQVMDITRVIKALDIGDLDYGSLSELKNSN